MSERQRPERLNDKTILRSWRFYRGYTRESKRGSRENEWRSRERPGGRKVNQRSLRDSTILHGVVLGVGEMIILKAICDVLAH